MTSSLSILLLGSQIAIGGAQKLLLEQAEFYAAHGHHVVGAFFYDRDGLHSTWQKKVSYPLYNLNAFFDAKSIIKSSSGLFRGLWALWRLLKLEHFDVIITFTHDSNILGLPLAWLACVPVRIATHLGGIRNIPRWREVINSWFVNVGVGQMLVAASEKTCRNAIREGVLRRRIVVIPNGINPLKPQMGNTVLVRQEIGLEENDIFLLTIGRLVYEKGHEFLIRAMADVVKKYPQAKVCICGDGPLKEQLQAEIFKNSLSNHVKLLGYWDDIAQLLASADIFVLPSRWEGLPLSLLEAMSMGLSPVATRVEGVDEVIIHGQHGLLVPIEDSEAMAAAILQLLNDPKAREQMGQAAKRRLHDLYTTDHMCEQYLALVHTLLDRKTLDVQGRS